MSHLERVIPHKVDHDISKEIKLTVNHTFFISQSLIKKNFNQKSTFFTVYFQDQNIKTVEVDFVESTSSATLYVFFA